MDAIEGLATQIIEQRIAAPLSSEEGLQLVTINDLISSRAKQLQQHEQYRRIDLKLELRAPRGATVRVSPEWLRRAFDAIVENAAQAVVGQKQPRITIGTAETNDGIEILVSDSAIPSPKIRR